ncbi:DUF721 domain-containing protein [Treponema ruminis]|uniref:DUF721 domain-containing protein n=1 Tax=Treponema ruminis TaxID=744515 RepID=A0A7W8G735_9SPIR|nr:DciA family protein [Treponema ruminis]MBB5225082.1 hypothetical protein [Treponema ruminis]QSI01003.1 DUF721 domain-containing protein [Treponema ruminis]
MFNEDNLISAQEMIMTAFTNIERAEVEKNNKLLKTWRFTLESIRSNAKNGENLGINLYSHSRVIDLKNGILLIEADHPAWIQTFRIYQKYILNGLKRGVPDVKISSLAFRLRGSNVELHSQMKEEKIRSNIEERIQKEEKVIQEFDEKNKNLENSQSQDGENSKNSTQNKEIPQNLRQILDRLKADILTDSK